MKRMLIVVAIIALAAGLAGTASAQTRPVQLALFNPVQIFPESNAIGGVRLSLIYGKNTSVRGIDLGLVNQNTNGESLGWQAGLVGLNEENFVGLQDCVINLTNANVEGVQFGLYNYAGHMSGIQIGFINNAGSMKGLQIGLVNIIRKGGFMPVFPIVNWSF